MKTRIYQKDLFAVVHFYNEQLAMQFGPRALSPAARERIRRGFAVLQKEKQKMERTNVWFVPYHVHFESSGEYTVSLADEKNVLVIE